jgi:predicted MFS family arabinose efflux permease
MGISGSVGDFGNFIAFISTGMISGVMGWRFPFLVWGIIALFIIGIYLFILRPKIESNLPKALSLKINPNSGFREKSTANKRLVTLTFAICILMGAMYRTFMNFTTLFLTDIVHVTPTEADLLFSLFVLTGVIGAFLSGYIAKYFGLQKAIIVEFLILSPAALLLYFNFAQTILITTILLGISGLILYTTYPTIYSLVANTASFGGRGRSYGFATSITFVGGALISIIDGILADALSNPSIVYLLGAFIALFAAIIATFLPPTGGVAVERV